MQIKIGDLVKTLDGNIGEVVSVSESGSESFPFVYEVECDGVLHVTNKVTRIKPMRLADLISITHNL